MTAGANERQAPPLQAELDPRVRRELNAISELAADAQLFIGFAGDGGAFFEEVLREDPEIVSFMLSIARRALEDVQAIGRVFFDATRERSPEKREALAMLGVSDPLGELGLSSMRHTSAGAPAPVTPNPPSPTDEGAPAENTARKTGGAR